jgi:hypothetical protein
VSIVWGFADLNKIWGSASAIFQTNSELARLKRGGGDPANTPNTSYTRTSICNGYGLLLILSSGRHVVETHSSFHTTLSALRLDSTTRILRSTLGAGLFRALTLRGAGSWVSAWRRTP